MISPRHPHGWRNLSQRLDPVLPGSYGGCICSLLLLLFASCSAATTTTHQATPTATAGPAPVLTPLAAAPQHCTLTPPPQQKTLASLGGNTDVHLVGGEPFWIYGSYYQSILHLQDADTEWPVAKMVVEVGPNYSNPVTLHLRNVQTGTLAWWTDGGRPPGAVTQTLLLDPTADTEDVGPVPGLPDIPHGAPDPGWKEWGLFPLFSAAGCYALAVSWVGGSWQSVFAAGS